MKKTILLITILCLLYTSYLPVNANQQVDNKENLQKLAFVLASKYLIKTEGIPKEYRSELKDFQEKLYKLYNQKEEDELNHLVCHTKKVASTKKMFSKKFKRVCSTNKINKEREIHLGCKASNSGGSRNASNPFDASMSDIGNCSNKKLPKSIQKKLHEHLVAVAKKVHTLLLSDPQGIALLKEYQNDLMPLTEEK